MDTREKEFVLTEVAALGSINHLAMGGVKGRDTGGTGGGGSSQRPISAFFSASSKGKGSCNGRVEGCSP